MRRVALIGTAVLLVALVPQLASAQSRPQPQVPAYESPATVAKRLKAQCAPLPPQQRRDCENNARAEIRASIARHHAMKAQGPAKPPARRQQ